MLFNIEWDSGSAIEGYLVPDGFADHPRIAVFDGADLSIQIDCTLLRDAVRVSGRHATGLVGFRLDETVIPALASKSALTIRDANSGLLLYRRHMPRWKQRRVVRLETQLVPAVAIDEHLAGHFQYAISRAERFGQETALQVFHLNNANSIYLAGRLQVRSFEQFLERDFDVIALLSEPYYEMAERLLFLNRFPTPPNSLFGLRDSLLLAHAAEHFARVDLESAKSLRTALKAISPAATRIIKAPLTRQLTTSLSDEEPNRDSVAIALDMLSRFAVVGLRSDPDTFIQPVADLLEVDARSIPPPKRHTLVANIAALLREIPQAEALIELDLVVYHFARQAILSCLKQRTTCG